MKNNRLLAILLSMLSRLLINEMYSKRPRKGHLIVAFIERWSLNTGQNIIRICRHLWDRWSLNTGGHQHRFLCVTAHI